MHTKRHFATLFAPFDEWEKEKVSKWFSLNKTEKLFKKSNLMRQIIKRFHAWFELASTKRRTFLNKVYHPKNIIAVFLSGLERAVLLA